MSAAGVVVEELSRDARRGAEVLQRSLDARSFPVVGDG